MRHSPLGPPNSCSGGFGGHTKVSTSTAFLNLLALMLAFLLTSSIYNKPFPSNDPASQHHRNPLSDLAVAFEGLCLTFAVPRSHSLCEFCLFCRPFLRHYRCSVITSWLPLVTSTLPPTTSKPVLPEAREHPFCTSVYCSRLHCC